MKKKTKKNFSLRQIRRAVKFAHEMDGSTGGTWKELSSDFRYEQINTGKEIADNIDDHLYPRSMFEVYIRSYLILERKNEKKNLRK